MKIRPPSFEIPVDNPFQYDLLDRRPSAEALTEIIRSSSDSLVLGIDAEWGKGKSTFIGMWRAHLALNGLKTLEFNAWESDFSDDAFVAIIGELELGMALLSPAGDGAGRALAKAKTVGVKIISRALPVAVKLATAGLIDASDFVEESISGAIEDFAREKIAVYEEAKKSVSGFKSALTEFAREVSGDHPLVIIVDELDRCRPSYAIDVLETIKHFFSVPGVVFVISADWSQLANIVRHRYGIGSDADAYLRRFVDLTFSLPMPEGDSFVKSQFNRFGLSDFFSKRSGRYSQYDYSHLSEVLPVLFRATDCSYRDQERCFSLLSLAARATPENMQLYGILLAALVVLKVKNSALYRDFCSRNAKAADVIAYFSRGNSSPDFFEDSRGYGVVLEAYLVKAETSSYRNSSVVDLYNQRLADQSLSETQRARASRIIEILKSYEFSDINDVLSYLIAKIDLVSNIR